MIVLALERRKLDAFVPSLSLQWRELVGGDARDLINAGALARKQPRAAPRGTVCSIPPGGIVQG